MFAPIAWLVFICAPIGVVESVHSVLVLEVLRSFFFVLLVEGMQSVCYCAPVEVIVSTPFVLMLKLLYRVFFVLLLKLQYLPILFSC